MGLFYWIFFWKSFGPLLQYYLDTLSLCAKKGVYSKALGSPAKATLSFTGVDFCSFTACVTFDVTAPVKFAVALPDSGILMSIITSSTTHQVTAIGLLGCFVAHSALCTHAASHRILFTVVG